MLEENKPPSYESRENSKVIPLPPIITTTKNDIQVDINNTPPPPYEPNEIKNIKPEHNVQVKINKPVPDFDYNASLCTNCVQCWNILCVKCYNCYKNKLECEFCNYCCCCCYGCNECERKYNNLPTETKFVMKKILVIFLLLSAMASSGGWIYLLYYYITNNNFPPLEKKYTFDVINCSVIDKQYYSGISKFAKIYCNVYNRELDLHCYYLKENVGTVDDAKDWVKNMENNGNTTNINVYDNECIDDEICPCDCGCCKRCGPQCGYCLICSIIACLSIVSMMLFCSLSIFVDRIDIVYK